MKAITERMVENFYEKIYSAIGKQGYESVLDFFNKNGQEIDITGRTLIWYKSQRKLPALSTILCLSRTLSLPLDYLFDTQLSISPDELRIVELLKQSDAKTVKMILTFLKEVHDWKG